MSVMGYDAGEAANRLQWKSRIVPTVFQWQMIGVPGHLDCLSRQIDISQ
jgi:hypothetical protein